MKTHRENRVPRPRRKLRLDWAGALSDLRDKYTSVELQHKILDLRIAAALDGCSNAEAIRRELKAADRRRSESNRTGAEDADRDTATARGAAPRHLSSDKGRITRASNRVRR
jgi:hypothetical protein